MRALFRNFVVLLILTTLSIQCQDTIHECSRECLEGEPPKSCHYEFQIEHYSTMTKACWDCPLNITDCYRHHCIPGIGKERGLFTINRQLPGPGIQVCKGDEIIVDIVNRLSSETTTMHWHGVRQVGTAYMDGVPLVTQCPISPLTTFRYRFWADNPGTHFYHSHSAIQRGDGIAGPFIIRQPEDPHKDLYDFDLSEHVLIVDDWLEDLSMTRYASAHHGEGHFSSGTILVNGKGRNYSEGGAEVQTPLSRFTVTKGFRYRFRMISNGNMNCPIQVSVDGHTLQAIASDGQAFEPVEVDSIVISSGERFDFVLNAAQNVDNYWIRFRGLFDCEPEKAHQVAILSYETMPNSEPNGDVTWENGNRPGKILNPINKGSGLGNEISIGELDAVNKDDALWNSDPDVKIWLPYDFYMTNNLNFHDPDHYPVHLGVVDDSTPWRETKYISEENFKKQNFKK
ncbi:hypothetical protein QYM36_006309 [Artemia franciscana]|uniref:Uncharacterized protein n=1 Tax=Artemia franciscana TaxID=6661 RepID=A0AA88HX77_ARTSF|nr:hypothetical protein QYM36_006309 [Artemia franciscana]